MPAGFKRIETRKMASTAGEHHSGSIYSACVVRSHNSDREPK